MNLFETKFESIQGEHEITPIQIRDQDGSAMVFIDIGCPVIYGGCDENDTEDLLKQIVRDRYFGNYELKKDGFEFTNLGYQGCDDVVIPITIEPESTRQPVTTTVTTRKVFTTKTTTTQTTTKQRTTPKMNKPTAPTTPEYHQTTPAKPGYYNEISF